MFQKIGNLHDINRDRLYTAEVGGHISQSYLLFFFFSSAGLLILFLTLVGGG